MNPLPFRSAHGAARLAAPILGLAVLLLGTPACTQGGERAAALPAPGDTIVLSSEFSNGDVIIATGPAEKPDSSTVRVPPGTAAVLLEIEQGEMDADDKLVRYRVSTLVGRRAVGWVYRGDTRTK